jgi:glutamate-1-semialdehyde 2,1-aminomutase
MAAGIETLRVIDETDNFYQSLEESGRYLEEGLRNAAREAGVDHMINRCGSMFTIFFTNDKVTDFTSAKKSDTSRFTSYFNQMLDNGVYLPPSQFEACFVSAAHQKNDLDKTISAAEVAFSTL